ncbi:TetR/AcrR family transcriptional regulator [Parasphingorhabdus sp.]|uniref:TetR/AcrR family transcriptional regulator n=1 Tax=Parasphingorhabdus sp. TaxID=2709688 RepID=UPI003A90A106
MSGKPTKRGLGRPTKSEAKALDAHVLDEALALFGSAGFAAVSVESIALRCGVGKNTIYRRYPDKEALFKAAVDREITRLNELGQELSQHVSDPLEAIRLTVQQMSKVLHEPQVIQMMRLLVAEGHRFPHLAEDMDRWLTALFKRLDALIEDATASGRMPKRPVKAVREALFTLFAAPSLNRLILDDQSLNISDAEFDLRWNLFVGGAAASMDPS